MSEQLVAMKIDRGNLERLFNSWPSMRGVSEFVYQLVYVSARGETVYLIAENGKNPFTGQNLRGRILVGSDLRRLYTYGAPALGTFWFPIYRRT
jgi:hypothetical protein